MKSIGSDRMGTCWSRDG